eukprot:765576-Hanusia_phi.AAC.3
MEVWQVEISQTNGTSQYALNKLIIFDDPDQGSPKPRKDAAVQIYGDFLVVFGGASFFQDQDWGDLNDLWILKLTLDQSYAQLTWLAVVLAGDAPRPRACAGMLLVDPYVFVFSGANVAAGELSDM